MNAFASLSSLVNTVLAALMSLSLYWFVRNYLRARAELQFRFSELQEVDPHIIELEYDKNGVTIVRQSAKTTTRTMTQYRRHKQQKPPRAAHGMVRLLSSYKYQEELLGDLDEQYFRVRAEHGPWFSKLWYWDQAVRSTVVVSAVRLLRWSFLIAVGDKIKRFIS